MQGRYPLWVTQLGDARGTGERMRLSEPTPWGSGVALALAPHPDDPDAIAVTLRLLVETGWDLYWTVVTSGWSGVQDDYCGPEHDVKALTRMSEQIQSARMFGLPEDRLLFMGLSESDDGELAWTDRNYQRFNSTLSEITPSVVLLPHGNDSNPTHRMVYQWFAEWADEHDGPILSLGNEDPKTEGFRPHTQVLFGEDEAHWKSSLLECHRTQSLRNQATRGITFADRILEMNRRAAGDGPTVYAERFHAELRRIP